MHVHDRKKLLRRTGLILMAVAILSATVTVVAISVEVRYIEDISSVSSVIAFTAFVFSLPFLLAPDRKSNYQDVGDAVNIHRATNDYIDTDFGGSDFGGDFDGGD